MLRISKITDYGIVLLTELARGGAGELHNARALAETAKLPLPVVSKTLKALTRHGLLVSQRGAKGGFSLARAPERIGVAEVIDALEGPVGLTECSAHAGGCQRESICGVREPWQHINHVIVRALRRVTLADLIAQPGDLIDLDLTRRAGSAANAKPN